MNAHVLFLHHVIAKWHCFSVLIELTNQKLPYHQAELIKVIRVPAWTSERPQIKNCGGWSYYWTELARNGTINTMTVLIGWYRQICLRDIYLGIFEENMHRLPYTHMHVRACHTTRETRAHCNLLWTTNKFYVDHQYLFRQNVFLCFAK